MTLTQNFLSQKKKPVFFNLLQIFGLGDPLSRLVVKSFGLQKFSSGRILRSSILIKMAKIFFFLNIAVDQDLKQQLATRFNESLRLKQYKALRLLAGLPVRGQRTKTNAQTSKRRKNLG